MKKTRRGEVVWPVYIDRISAGCQSPGGPWEMRGKTNLWDPDDLRNLTQHRMIKLYAMGWVDEMRWDVIC